MPNYENRPFASIAEGLDEDAYNGTLKYIDRLNHSSVNLLIRQRFGEKGTVALRWFMDVMLGQALLAKYAEEAVRHNIRYLFLETSVYTMQPHTDYPVAEHFRLGAAAAIIDKKKRMVTVMEFNKVKGLVPKQYRLATFIKKMAKTYVTHSSLGPDETAKILMDSIDIMFPSLKEMSLVITDKPSEMYKQSGVRSCMSNTEFVKFYDTAPVQGIMVKLKDKMIARTLLWTASDGRRFYDRIYDSTGSIASSLIIKWAKENNVLCLEDEGTGVVVEAPYSPHGLPYLDNMINGIRCMDTVYLSPCYSTICQVFDDLSKSHHYSAIVDYHDFITTRTSGKSYDYQYKQMVECEGGVYSFNPIEFDGKLYAYEELPTVTQYNIHVFKLDTVVRHPYEVYKVCYAGDLILDCGQIVLRKDIV